VQSTMRKRALPREQGEDDYSVRIPNGRGGATVDRVLASGVVEGVPVVVGGAIAGAFIASRKHDIYWGIGTLGASLLIAGAARNNSVVRDAMIGVLGGAATTLTLRAIGKLRLSSGQQ